MEELWAFNDEELARAIFRSRVPIISAVGHETDFSISDFVADLRAPTPSAAAEVALPEASEVKRKLLNVIDRMSLVSTNRIKLLYNRVDALARSPKMVNMMNFVDDRRMALTALDRDMERAMERLVETKKSQTLQIAAKLDALSPLAVLSRGYSAVFDGSGRPVNTKERLRPGDTVTIRLTDANASAQITEVKEL